LEPRWFRRKVPAPHIMRTGVISMPADGSPPAPRPLRWSPKPLRPLRRPPWQL
jgi:hypothetical protein